MSINSKKANYPYEDIYFEPRSRQCFFCIYDGINCLEYPCCFCPKIWDEQGYERNIKYFNEKFGKVVFTEGGKTDG